MCPMRIAPPSRCRSVKVQAQYITWHVSESMSSYTAKSGRLHPRWDAAIVAPCQDSLRVRAAALNSNLPLETNNRLEQVASRIYHSSYLHAQPIEAIRGCQIGKVDTVPNKRHLQVVGHNLDTNLSDELYLLHRRDPSSKPSRGSFGSVREYLVQSDVHI
jgi:hypothetical protein